MKRVLSYLLILTLGTTQILPSIAMAAASSTVIRRVNEANEASHPRVMEEADLKALNKSQVHSALSKANHNLGILEKRVERASRDAEKNNDAKDRLAGLRSNLDQLRQNVDSLEKRERDASEDHGNRQAKRDRSDDGDDEDGRVRSSHECCESCGECAGQGSGSRRGSGIWGVLGAVAMTGMGLAANAYGNKQYYNSYDGLVAANATVGLPTYPPNSAGGNLGAILGAGAMMLAGANGGCFGANNMWMNPYGGGGGMYNPYAQAGATAFLAGQMTMMASPYSAPYATSFAIGGTPYAPYAPTSFAIGQGTVMATPYAPYATSFAIGGTPYAPYAPTSFAIGQGTVMATPYAPYATSFAIGGTPYAPYAPTSFAIGQGTVMATPYAPYATSFAIGGTPYAPYAPTSFAIGQGTVMATPYAPYATSFAIGGTPYAPYAPTSFAIGQGTVMATPYAPYATSFAIGQGTAMSPYGVPYSMPYSAPYSTSFAIGQSTAMASPYAPTGFAIGQATVMASPYASAPYAPMTGIPGGGANGQVYGPPGFNVGGGGQVGGNMSNMPGQYCPVGYPGPCNTYMNPYYGTNPYGQGGMTAYNPWMTGANGSLNNSGLNGYYQYQMGAAANAANQARLGGGNGGTDATLTYQAYMESYQRQMQQSYYGGGSMYGGYNAYATLGGGGLYGGLYGGLSGGGTVSAGVGGGARY